MTILIWLASLPLAGAMLGGLAYLVFRDGQQPGVAGQPHDKSIHHPSIWVTNPVTLGVPP
jgi:hypothetical protein